MNQTTETIPNAPLVFTLAVASVPIQNADFDALFPLAEGLTNGTIFPELYMPLLAVGGAK